MVEDVHIKPVPLTAHIHSQNIHNEVRAESDAQSERITKSSQKSLLVNSFTPYTFGRSPLFSAARRESRTGVRTSVGATPLYKQSNQKVHMTARFRLQGTGILQRV